jgi:hypothetical protein
VTAMSRALVYLRRIAGALDRAYPPAPAAPAPRRPVEFSIATPRDFEQGWDERNQDQGPSR